MSNSYKRSIGLLLVFVAVAIGLIVLLLNKAEQSDQPNATPPQEAAYRLKWLANTGFVGDLYADTYGYFLKEGLKVTVKPGGPEHDAIRELQTGDAAFGVASADQVLQALEKGADVVVVAQLYRKNPVQWIYRSAKATIQTPADLKGKKVGVAIGDNDEAIMQTLLKKHNVQPSDLELVGIKYDFSPFTTGQVDLFPVYRNTQGVELEAQLAASSEDVGFFDPDAAGVRFVANSIVTTSRMVQDKPDLVRRFVRAALQGWRDSLARENEERAIRAIERFVPASTEGHDKARAIIRDQLAVTRDLVVPSNQAPLGSIDVQSWEETEAIMKEAGTIKKSIGIKGYLRTDFVKKDK